VSRIPRLALVAAVAAGLSLAAAGPAVASPSSSVRVHVALSAYSGPPGAAVRVSGSGFAARETVDISFATTADTADRTAGHTNRSGSFSGVLIKVPVGTVPGDYRIRAVGRRSGRRGGATFTVHTNWAQYGYGPGRTGYNPDENVLSPSAVPGLALAWHFATGNEVFSSPAVVNGVAYVGSLNSAVYALNAATGARRWVFHTDGGVASSPPVVGGVVYVGTDHTDVGDLLAFNAATGKRIWDIQDSNGAVDAAPAVANGVVYWAASGSVYATDAATATNLWSFNLSPMEMQSDPAVADGVVYFGADDGNLYALDTATGSKLWSFSTGSAIQNSPAVADGRIYIGSDNGNEYAFALPGS
jgi:outer membrane protein assembly factor BamB